MRITSVMPIEWHNKEYIPKKPSDFPCMFCGDEIGTHRITAHSGSVGIKLIICESCIDKGLLQDQINNILEFEF